MMVFWILGYLVVGFVVAVLISYFDSRLGSDAPPFILLWPLVVFGVALWALSKIVSDVADWCARRLP